MPDWKKEIKLSDLFSRGSKEPEAKAPEAEAPFAPRAEKGSLLKKEISFSLRRKGKAPKEPTEPGARKPSRAERRAAKQEARAAAKLARKEKAKAPKGARRSAPPAPAVPVMRAFNLLPQDSRRENAGRRPSTVQLVLAVVALVAFAGLAAFFLMLSASVADKRAEADSLRAAAAARPNPAEQPSDPDTEADEQLEQEQQARTSALASALGRRVAWDRLLREFSLVVPDDVSLTKITATGGGAGSAVDPAAPAGTPAPESVFTIEGYTESQESVARLLGRLAVLPELSAVDLESSVATELGPSKTKVFQFVVRTIVKPATGSTL